MYRFKKEDTEEKSQIFIFFAHYTKLYNMPLNFRENVKYKKKITPKESLPDNK